MKFFVDKNQISDNNIEIIGKDVNHIKNVLRKKENDKLTVVCKENNKNYIVQIEDINDENKIISKIIEEKEGNSESNISIHIFQGLPKSDKMELIIQKCTELGVTDITPVIFKRSVVKLDEKDKEKQKIRWQKIAEVAAKQCERDNILEVHDVININELSNKLSDFDKAFIAYEKEEDRFLKSELREINDTDNINIAVIIGPEGGIDENEIEQLVENGAISISLGKRILRTETAPIVLSSIIMYELGDIGGK